MGFVYDRSTDRSDLVLLDGQTLETVATVHLPARVPHGFHGNWVPGRWASEARASPDERRTAQVNGTGCGRSTSSASAPLRSWP